MDESKSALRPCPFCGKGDMHIITVEIDDNYYDAIECRECGAVFTNCADTERELYAAWNKRADNRKSSEEIIHCKDCKWWDQLEDGHPYGFCRACQSGTYTARWDISIHRLNKFDFFCADAEPKENEDDDE